MGTRATYAVLSHEDPQQVQRLVGAILRSSPDASVVVACDARTVGPPEFDDTRVDVFAHGRRSDWGSWDLVEATLDAFTRARTVFDPELVVLVSGQDYPMRVLPDWEREALAADGWIGTAAPIEYRPRWGRKTGEGDDRLTRYTYRWFRAPWAEWARTAGPRWWRMNTAIALRLEPVFNVRVVPRGRGLHYGVRRFPRPFSADRPCYVGSQWLALRRNELDSLLDVDFAVGSRWRRVYRRTVIPDESALVTALSRRGPAAVLAGVTATNWDVVADRPLTRVLDDLPALLATGSPFCRKVDPVASATLMDELDRLIV